MQPAGLIEISMPASGLSSLKRSRSVSPAREMVARQRVATRTSRRLLAFRGFSELLCSMRQAQSTRLKANSTSYVKAALASRRRYCGRATWRCRSRFSRLGTPGCA